MSRSLAPLGLTILLAACSTPEPPAPAEKPAAPAPTVRPPLVPPKTPDPALAVAQRRVRVQPSADSWAQLATAWLSLARQGVPQAEAMAEASLKEALGLGPKHPRARILKATMAKRRGQAAEALKVARALAKDAPSLPEVWGLLSDLSLEAGRYAEASEAAQKMLALRPGLPAYSRAARLRWLHGDVSGAQALWGQALEAASAEKPEPGAWVLGEAGHIAWKRGRVDKAERLYRKALRRFRTEAGARVGYALVKRTKGKDPIPDLSKAVVDGDHAEARAWLAAELEAKGEAVDAHLKVLEAMDPRRAALWQAHRKRPTTFATPGSEEVYAADAQGFVLFRRGAVAKARALLEKALRLGTPEPRFHAHLGLVLASTKDAGARAHLEKAQALRHALDPPLAAEVQAVLEALPTPQ